MSQKVNDNLHSVAYDKDFTRLRRRMDERACLCPVCKPTTEPVAEDALHLESLRRWADPGSVLGAAPQEPIDLGYVPNATGVGRNGPKSHPEWVDEYQRENGGVWEDEIREFSELFREKPKTGGYVHHYRECGKRYMSWRPKGMTRHRPPVRVSRCSEGLSGKQQKRIIHAAIALGEMCRESGDPVVFMTLTYKWRDTCHQRAKRDLDTFLKRYKRHTGCTTFLWVAELQKRGTIHFHLLVTSRVDMDWYQTAWSEITGQPVGQQDIRFKTDVEQVGLYMGKYCSKGSDGKIFAARYGMSRDLSRAIKPETMLVVPCTYDEFCDKVAEIAEEKYDKVAVLSDFVVSLGHEDCEYHEDEYL
jgi:hypothetical protein